MLPLLLSPLLGQPDVKRCGRIDLHEMGPRSACTAFISEFERLSTPEVEALALALRSAPSLAFLQLRTQGFEGDDDAANLLAAAADSTRLDTLIFRVSSHPTKSTLQRLSTAAASALSDAIRANKGLVTLDLRETSLGDDGFALIADALAESSSLKHLLLGGNGMTGEGVAPVVKVIAANNEALETIDFSNNRWGDAGASALAAALTQHAGALRDVVFQDHPAVVGDGAGRKAIVAMAKARLGDGLNVWTNRRENKRTSWVGLEDKTEL